MFKYFAYSRVLILFIVITIIGFISLWIAWAVEESSSNNIVLLFISKTSYIFTFPFHYLFKEYLNGELFIVGVLFNALFYSFLIEAIWIIIIKYLNK
jgi:hypothetical protein